MSAIIYLLTNTVNGKQYVGQTSRGLEKRWIKHCQTAYRGSNQYLHRAIRKYEPKSFTQEILEETTVEFANDREIYWISKLNTKEIGYNMTNGGEGTQGYVPNEETRTKLSLIFSGKNNPHYGKTHTEKTKINLSLKKLGENNPFYGKVLSDEHRMKISAAKMGKIKSEQTRKKMSSSKRGKPGIPGHLQSTAKKITINNITYQTLQEAHLQTGISRPTLRKMWKLQHDEQRTNQHS